MRMFRRQIEERLSAMVGGDVRCRDLDVSPLKGVVDVWGVSVRFDGDPEPALEVKRVKVAFALGGVLRKTLTVKSAVLERPALRFTLNGDGQMNPPLRARRRGEARGTQGQGWSLDLHRVLVVDGEASFHGHGYEFAASGILAELVREGDGFRFTLIFESPARGAAGAALGEVKFTGQLSGVTDMTELASARLFARGDVGGALRVRVDSPSIGSGDARLEVHGTIDLSHLSAVLPSLVGWPRAPHRVDGRARVDAVVVHTPAQGWKCESLNLVAHDVSLEAAVH